jgi:hypothetical protein
MEVNMHTRRIAGLIAATFVVSTTAFAQSENRPATGQQSQVSPNTTMTLVGCLMRESDYRKAHNLGKGALGGVGLGDEFVLVDATDSSSAPAARSTSTTCTETGSGKAYRMTGKAEEQLKPFVGRRIEVTGQFDHERDAKTAAGETDAKLPPEVKIASFHAVSSPGGQAPAAASASPAPQPAPSTPSQVASNDTSRQRQLPKTASNEPLFALIGLLCLTAALGARLVRFGVS